MAGETLAAGGGDEVHRPVMLDEADPGDARALAELRADARIAFRDLRAGLRAEFDALAAPPELGEGPEADRWVHYPWRRAVVALPGPRLLRAVRLDRNRNKLTREEQQRLAAQTIGVVGQSVGHAVAHALAMEGTCGRLLLADFDAMELTNLNRVPGTLFDVGVNKAVAAARRIAELDPYLPVTVFPEGLTDANLDAFLDELTIVVEECDSLDVKMAVREGARRHRLPLLMETSDRGLLDVERFDLEPQRPPFHGLLGDTTAAAMRGLSTREKAPFVARILDARGLSASMAASLVEIEATLSGWPQLAGDVQLGGALVAAAVRRIGLGQPLPSGRTRADLDACLNALAEPEAPAEPAWPEEDPEEEPSGAVAAVLACARRAPSGGNAQPWTLSHDDSAVTIALDPRRTTAMDVGLRGSALAIGAALYNARAAAAAHGLRAEADVTTAGPAPLTAVLRLRPVEDPDPDLAQDHPALLARHTNRRPGDGTPLAPGTPEALAAVAAASGARLHALTARPAIEAAAALLAASDRVRYLTPRLHAEMFAELRLPGEDPRTGLDLRTMELTPDERAKLDIGRRADVMARIRAFGGGAALGDYTRDRVLGSAAVVALTLPVPPPHDDLPAHARAGEALQRVWAEAQRRSLAVQPVSPVFLFARTPGELHLLAPEFADELAALQRRLLTLLTIPGDEAPALLLRLSNAPPPTVRSRRVI
ncbi:Rv1355c family protein [Streptomyces sp. DSM 44917]|uniref:Rv1355c family protein n=1 Tax=Streptomyces boetiae TaxID=3075541 RepID=A0ABU2LFR1_9ACTN|nr:Rv1355c family protein [Streptomyces sp. DSM 44917]MDT0310424.1 Rv1355c family protein [Streptomyces sp. DSM 44917]